MSKPKIIFAANSAWNLLNFRVSLIRTLISSGYEVVALAPSDSYVNQLVALGCKFIPLNMDNQGADPGKDFLLFIRFLKILRSERPNIFLAYTIKPNIYGSLAANLLGIPVINNITGLGSIFISNSWLVMVVKVLYKFSLHASKKIFFQNNDDLVMFISHGLIDESRCDLLPGSGIDLKKFVASFLPRNDSVQFLLVSRMLWDKGVGEFVEAARLLKQRKRNIDCCLLGFLDVKNPSAISRSQMNLWVQAGWVRYLGVSSDVSKEISFADCVVLPSYREGAPRSLLEAAALGRPIIATDVAGCRDVVDDGQTGFLCNVKDAFDLAEKMEQFANLSHLDRSLMGQRGRKKVELQFDERIVITKYLDAISKFCLDWATD